MKHEIFGKPDFPAVRVLLEAGEKVRAEAGAMVSMTSNMKVETKMQGGFLSAAKRSLLGGESLFTNTFWPEGSTGEIVFAPVMPGDLGHRGMKGESFFMSSGAYVAGSEGVEIDSKWGRAQSFFGGEGLFILKASGTGDLFFSSFGAIHEVDVEGEYICDTGHIIAFEESLTYSITKVGGIKSLFLSGEGIVCHFKGTGKLYIQTRGPTGFAAWANQFRRVERSNN